MQRAKQENKRLKEPSLHRGCKHSQTLGTICQYKMKHCMVPKTHKRDQMDRVKGVLGLLITVTKKLYRENKTPFKKSQRSLFNEREREFVLVDRAFQDIKIHLYQVHAPWISDLWQKQKTTLLIIVTR